MSASNKPALGANRRRGGGLSSERKPISRERARGAGFSAGEEEVYAQSGGQSQEGRTYILREGANHPGASTRRRFLSRPSFASRRPCTSTTSASAWRSRPVSSGHLPNHRGASRYILASGQSTGEPAGIYLVADLLRKVFSLKITVCAGLTNVRST